MLSKRSEHRERMEQVRRRFLRAPINIEDLKNIEKEYFKNEGTFLIAEVNEKIVGTIAIKKEKNKVARLKRMFVDQKYRTKNWTRISGRDIKILQG